MSESTSYKKVVDAIQIPQFDALQNSSLPIGQSLTDQLQLLDNKLFEISQTVYVQLLLNRQSRTAHFKGVVLDRIFNRLYCSQLAAIFPNMFVSKYHLELPSTEKMTQFLKEQNEGLLKKEDNV